MRSIVFVFDGMGFGGIERIGIDYVRMCLERGYIVHIYNLNPSASQLVETIPKQAIYHSYKLSRKGCPETYSYGVQKWWWGKYAYALISPVMSMKQFLEIHLRKRDKFDIAIAISGHINDLSFVAKEYICSSKKICWCHGNLISYLAICDAYSILYRKIDSIITLSSAGEKDVYAGKKYLYEKEIVKIYNPTYIKYRSIDTDKVNLLRLQYGNFLLMVARIEPGKGHDVAINVVRTLKERGIDKHILFAGDGSLSNAMIELARTTDVSENCIFLGNCIDIQNYISASYINLLTSSYEGLPTVIIEAMTFGKPCVMTNSDDGEVSENGKYCYLLPVGDVEGISNSVYELFTSELTYKKYSDLAKERAQVFSPKVIESQLQKLIEN